MSDQIARVIETTRREWRIPAQAGFLLGDCHEPALD